MYKTRGMSRCSSLTMKEEPANLEPKAEGGAKSRYVAPENLGSRGLTGSQNRLVCVPNAHVCRGVALGRLDFDQGFARLRVHGGFERAHPRAGTLF